MLSFTEILLLIVTILYLLYKYGTSTYNHWKNQGLVQIDPKLPFVGNTWGFLMRKFHPADGTKIFYDTFSNETKMFGFYQFRKPLIMVKDPDLLKTIMVKDFDHFTDRNPLGTSDPEAVLLGKDLISLRGQAWRDMRNTLSPAFTSAKIKMVFDFVNKCGEQLTSYIEKDMKNKKNSDNTVEEDFKGLFTRFSADVIATAAFGIQVDSLTDQENEFYKNGMKMMNFSLRALLMFIMLSVCPKIMKKFNLSFFHKDILTYFHNTIRSSIKIREEKHIVRPDLIHLMLEARKGNLKDDKNQDQTETSKDKTLSLSDYEIATNCILFFFAGFETVSTSLCFMLHEIAVHQEVQLKLRNEIDDVVNNNGGKITYDGLIHQMKYLDMVVSESLRKWPAMFNSERQVSKPYVFKHEGVPGVKLNTGDMIFIPIYAIHRDPEYYPDPDKFDPERFNEENKSKIKPYTYLPFGAGPRSCIGNRFALMEIKMCLAHLLRKFVILPTESTRQEIKLDRLNVVSLAAEGGFNYKLRLRDREEDS